jgi:hypothetical protein
MRSDGTPREETGHRVATLTNRPRAIFLDKRQPQIAL